MKPSLSLALLTALLGACSKKPPQEDSFSMNEMYALRRLLNEAEGIVTGPIQEVDRSHKTAIVKVEHSLRGTDSPLRFQVDFSGYSHPDLGEAVQRHFVVGSPVVLFYSGSNALLYLNRFFLMGYGTGNGPDPKWSTTNVEGRMNRTYNRPVPELIETIKRVFEGRGPAPAPDPDLKPITSTALNALPLWGPAGDEESLPAPFSRKTPPTVPLRAPDPTAASAPGIRFARLVKGFRDTNDWDDLIPEEQGVVPVPVIPAILKREPMRLRFRGFLDVPKDGDYSLYAACGPDSYAILAIGGDEVLTGRAPEQGADLGLKAGKHAILLSYECTDKEAKLQLLWSGPGFDRRPIPAEAFVHDPARK